MLIIQDLSYTIPDKHLLFSNINLTVSSGDKLSLIGNNGTGKSTLLKIIAGELFADDGGTLALDTKPYYVPQLFPQDPLFSVAQGLGANHKLCALAQITKGNISERYYDALDNDWGVEERCLQALSFWGLEGLSLETPFDRLSGGEKTKVYLAGIHIHHPDLILLDEPTNHLDISGRRLLYDFVKNTSSALIVVSHDRKLLNLLGTSYELQRHGLSAYGGNYDFYIEQKQSERASLQKDIGQMGKALRKAKEKRRNTLERQQRSDARGKRKQEQSGVARIMMNTLRNHAENSTSKIKNIHSQKIEGLSKELHALRASLPEADKMKIDLPNSALRHRKILFSARRINITYDKQSYLWKSGLNVEILGGERLAIRGKNGSGKTSLIKIILGELAPQTGSVFYTESNAIYIDQDYSLINSEQTVLKQVQQFNVAGLLEHEIKTRLNLFLFTANDWVKPGAALSGGERMRLLLCCLTLRHSAPDMLVLDEPTNNLDIQNVEILTKAVNDYRGTLIVVSHDEYFLDQINIERYVDL